MVSSGDKNAAVVSLVGAGPGDPGLLTLHAVDRLRNADVIIYDHLIPPFVLELANAAAQRIYVGKWGAETRAMPQEAINDLMVVCAKSGRRVVRMKGGDPFVFGRGGEEASHLAAHKIPFEIIPGVTSAIAAPAYAAIPVTDRRLSSSFLVVTGHENPERVERRVDWGRIANAADTLVILMGFQQIESICLALTAAGRSPDTPAAVISGGTGARQVVVEATLATLPSILAQHPPPAPSLCIVGDVVRLRKEINWVETRPLWGLRVLVPQSRDQGLVTCEKLMNLGAEPVLFPTIQLVPPADIAAIKLAIKSLAEYNWIVFSSANAVDWFFRWLFECDQDTRSLGTCRVAVIGSATAARLRHYGVIPDVVPAQFHAEALVDALIAHAGPAPASTWRVLFPRAEEGRDVLPQRLRSLGTSIDVLPVYRTVLNAAADGRALEAALAAGQIDVGIFTSPSTFRNMVELLGGCDSARAVIDKMTLVAIGETTASEVRKFGSRVDILPAESSIDSVLDALKSWVSAGRTNAATDVGTSPKPKCPPNDTLVG
ncbi:MAG: uroporphyrinogen-III C-methyltransferase [Myxococcales bacterium]|nr:uroporphyrinogen-III C-methyltransferase [Myxococcales bacterium]